MRGSSSVRHSAWPVSSYICKPCLRRQIHTNRLLRAASQAKPPDIPTTKPSALKDAETAKAVINSSTEPFNPTKSRITKTEILKWRKRGGVPPAMFQPYSPDEWEQLREKYTPAQINAIQAAEEAVDPQDLAQSKIRTNDPWAIDYDDDFSAHHPVLDKRVNPSEETNYDPKLRFKTDEEIKQDFTNFIASLGKDEKDLTGLEYQQFRDNQRIMVGKAQAEHNPINYLAPAIPKEIDGLAEMATIEPVDAIPEEDRILLRQTGYTREEVRGLKSKILVTHRVMNQTRLGKIQSIYVLMVVGNTKGLVGIGEGKTADSKDAIKQARNAALRGMVPIQRYERRTIFGDVKGKVGATQLELMNRPPGFGLRCMHLIYEICKCAGIEDLAARVTRARNPMNVVKATMQALTNQRTPDEMARGLGRKLVDVRKVYYGGVDNLQAQITT